MKPTDLQFLRFFDQVLQFYTVKISSRSPKEIKQVQCENCGRPPFTRMAILDVHTCTASTWASKGSTHAVLTLVQKPATMLEIAAAIKECIQHSEKKFKCECGKAGGHEI